MYENSNGGLIDFLIPAENQNFSKELNIGNIIDHLSMPNPKLQTTEISIIDLFNLFNTDELEIEEIMVNGDKIKCLHGLCRSGKPDLDFLVPENQPSIFDPLKLSKNIINISFFSVLPSTLLSWTWR